MKRDFNPVDVELSIENPSIERGAFYRLCFITESNTAPRTLKVTRLQDLLDNGYSRLDLVYNFCVGVFSQQGMDTIYIRAKRSSESYVEAYDADDNSMYYFVVLQTKDLTEIEKFNNHLVSSDEMKLQFFSQNVGSKILQSPKLVNYYQDYTLSGGASVESKDYYLNKAYSGVTVVSKMPLPDYLLAGHGNTAVDYGVRVMVGKDYIWEIDKPNRQIRYARSVVESGWVGSREESTVNGSEVTIVATKGTSGKLFRASIKDPKVKIETISRELLKGLGKEVLDYAIPLIYPEATDWVLDPTNNRVEYKITDSSWSNNYDGLTYPTADAAGAGFCSRLLKDSPSASCTYSISDNQIDALIKHSPTITEPRSTSLTRNTLPTVLDYIPISTVSQQVIANADSGHLESKKFLKSIPLFAYLLTGSGTEAVNKAVLDIDAEATDWVLDPANNRVVYKEKTSGTTGGFYYKTSGSVKNYVPDPVSHCINVTNGVPDWDTSANTPTSPSLACRPKNLVGVKLWYYQDGAFVIIDKYLPFDTVAAQVTSNAEAGHSPSQEALRLSTVERVNTGEYDEALEAASTEIETSWKYLPIYDVAVQVKRNSIAGHAESIEAVNNSLPFELPDNDTPWAYVPEETSIAGSTTTIKAERTFENQKLKSSITVAASVSKVGQYLIKGGGSDSLDYAVVELIGEGIDWVLDSANNAVRYKNPDYDPNAPSGGWCVDCNSISPVWGSTGREAIEKFWVKNGKPTTGDIECRAISETTYYCVNHGVTDGTSFYKPDGVTDLPTESEYESIPIDTVAAQVISNAEAGHAPSQEAVKATALEGFVAGEHDAALDAAAVIDN